MAEDKPTRGKILESIKRKLRGARYAIGDVAGTAGRALRRVPEAIASACAGFWSRLSLDARRWLFATAAGAALLVALLTLVVPNLPCQLPGGDSCPPPDDAAQLIPADSLAYVHANLDPEQEQFAAATEIAELVPNLTRQLAGRALAGLPGAAGVPPDFERDVRPWFDGEAAMVVVGGIADTLEQVELLEVADPEGAAEFATQIAVGTVEPEDYQGTELSVDDRGLATAQLHGFLAIGSSDGIRALVDVTTETEGVTSLAEDPIASELREELPEHHLIDAYLSSEGVGELIGDSTGIEGSLAPFMAPGATAAAAASLSAQEGEVELAVRSALDPERVKVEPGFFAAFEPFEPQIPAELSADALGYVGFGDPATTVQALLGQASAQAPGIVSGFDDLARDLREQGGVDLGADLLSGLGREAAFAVESRSGTSAGEGQGAVVSSAGLPYVEFVADGVDEDEARRTLAALQGPLAAAVDPATGLQAPVFDEQQVEGVEVRTLRLSPAVELAYAVFDGLAVVASDVQGIERLAAGEGAGLDESDLYLRATESFADEVSLQAFLDLGELVAVGENLGLGEDPAYAAFAGEFRRLDAFALAVNGTDSLLSTDARLVFDD